MLGVLSTQAATSTSRRHSDDYESSETLSARSTRNDPRQTRLQSAAIFKHTSCKSCCAGADTAHASNPGKTLWTSTSSAQAVSGAEQQWDPTTWKGTMASPAQDPAHFFRRWSPERGRRIWSSSPRPCHWMTGWVVLTRPERPHHSWTCLSNPGSQAF